MQEETNFAHNQTIESSLYPLSERLPSAPCIPRGAGFSYGDSALSENLLLTQYNDNILSFSREKAEVSVQAGISLKRLNQLLLSKGFFLKTTPGSQYISVGGAIAADAHGKNHLRVGSFSHSVRKMSVLLGSDQKIECSPTLNQDLFQATCGGLGLTGVILEATLDVLPVGSSLMSVHSNKCRDVSELIENLIEKGAKHSYAVSWMDGLSTGKRLGKGLVSGADHLDGGRFLAPKKGISIPCLMPAWIINRGSLKAFNRLYYQKTRAHTHSSLEAFFYPLDDLHHWPRLYGKDGLIQHQSLFPFSQAKEGIKALLRLIQKHNIPPTLIVLKILGTHNENLLSFAREGVTLAIDFKSNPKTKKLFPLLDECVLSYQGRMNLAKDKLMSLETFRSSYPNWQQFQEVRKKWGAVGVFESCLSRRLAL